MFFLGPLGFSPIVPVSSKDAVVSWRYSSLSYFLTCLFSQGRGGYCSLSELVMQTCMKLHIERPWMGQYNLWQSKVSFCYEATVLHT